MTDEPYDTFLRRGWSPNWHLHPSPGACPLEMVLVEPRNLPNLRQVLENMSCVLPFAALTIICSQANHDTLRSFIPLTSHVQILNSLPENLTRDEYSALLTSASFWAQFASNKVLFFQCDSGIRYNNILQFMQYDYVGAPWPWPIYGDPRIVQGNGGFSLRTVSWMKHICATFPFSHATYESEDMYFAKHILDCDDAVVATKEVASSFSVEYIPHAHPMGFHQAWRFYDPPYVSHLLQSGLDPIHASHAIRVQDAWIQTPTQERMDVPDIVPWLQLGVGSAGFRMARGTRTPWKSDPAPGAQKTLVIVFAVGLPPKSSTPDAAPAAHAAPAAPAPESSLHQCTVKLHRGYVEQSVDIRI